MTRAKLIAVRSDGSLEPSVRVQEVNLPKRLSAYAIAQLIAKAADGVVKSIYVDPDTGDVFVTRADGTVYPAGRVKGAQGDRGPKGDSITGAQGPKGDIGPASIVPGPKGDTGKDGTSVTIKGSVASVGQLPVSGNTIGDGWIVTANGHLYVWSGTAFADAGEIRGPKGDTGPVSTVPGPKGDTGPVSTVPGPKGDPGPASTVPGPKGDPGIGLNYLTPAPGSDDLPVTFKSGISYFQIGAPTGTTWPIGYFTGRVTRVVSGRTVMEAISAAGIETHQRTENSSDGTWMPWVQISGSTSPIIGVMRRDADGQAQVLGPPKSLNYVANKKYVDDANTLPYGTKLAADLASTYPHGVTTTLGKLEHGWPLLGPGEAFVSVVTTKTVGYSGGTTQWAYPYKNPAYIPLFRIADSNGVWGEWTSFAKTDLLYAEEFGAKGDGTTDDTVALQAAINYGFDNYKTLVLLSGHTYIHSAMLTNPTPTSVAARKTVAIRSSMPGSQAILKMADSVPAANHSRSLNFSGATLATTTLTGSTQFNNRRWYVGTSSSFVPGTLMGIESSLPWYYDPRSESTDARKSEVHRIASKDGRYLFSEAPAFDGYITSAETVKVHPFIPIGVNISDISIERTLPPEGTAADNYRRVGLDVSHASDGLISNVSVYGGTAGGIKLTVSYNTKIVEGVTTSANNYYEGYGVQIGGSTYCGVEKRMIISSRRGVDISQGDRFVSRYCYVRNSTIVGGGKNSRGVYYNYSPEDGSLGDSQSGMGSHGPSDGALYEGNTIHSMHAGITCRGSNEIIRGNTFIGRFRLDAIALAEGGGLYIIEGNNVVSGYEGTRKNITITDGGGNINTRRAAMFLKIYPNFDSANGQVVVRNNYAEVQDIFIQFGVELVASSVPLRCTIVNNIAMFAAQAASADRYVLFNPMPGELISGLYRWTYANNRMSNQSGTGTILRTKGINLVGAAVLDTTTSAATT